MSNKNINRLSWTEKWVSKAEKHNPFMRSLYDKVISELCPKLESRGYALYDDYAGGNKKWTSSNELPFQQRVHGKEWPTIVIEFSPKQNAYFKVHFCTIPSLCVTLEGEQIYQKNAPWICSPVIFLLRKGLKENYKDQFYGLFDATLFKDKRIERDISLAKENLETAFQILEKGVPTQWYGQPIGNISKNVFLEHAYWIEEGIKLNHSVP